MKQHIYKDLNPYLDEIILVPKKSLSIWNAFLLNFKRGIIKMKKNNFISPSNNSILRPYEKAFADKVAKYVPKYIGTKHLTILSFLSSIFMLICFYLAQKEKFFMFCAVFFILLQWLFDCLDGTVGRLRTEGFVRWGFYMDHLFDYFFVGSLLIGLYFNILVNALIFLILFFLISIFFVSAFLFHDVYMEKKHLFEMSFLLFSPIEFRILFIIITICSYWYALEMGVFLLNYGMHIIILITTFLIIYVYYLQKKLSDIDNPIKSGK